jgi:TM2 domain-containing membrane protein YozV
MGSRHNPRDKFAAVLSLFWPGAGHFYKGHLGLAIVFAGLGVLCFLWSITFLMFFGFLSLPAYWIAVSAMAYFAPDLKHPANAQPVGKLNPVLD